MGLKARGKRLAVQNQTARLQLGVPSDISRDDVIAELQRLAGDSDKPVVSNSFADDIAEQFLAELQEPELPRRSTAAK